MLYIYSGTDGEGAQIREIINIRGRQVKKSRNQK